MGFSIERSDWKGVRDANPARKVHEIVTGLMSGTKVTTRARKCRILRAFAFGAIYKSTNLHNRPPPLHQ